MPDDAPPAAEAPLAPEEVSDRSFPTAFRGFDPVEVRSFLGRVADEVRRLQVQEAELRRLLQEAAARPPDEEAAVIVAAAEAEAGALVSTAGAEAAQAVSAARSEADVLLREARDRVATLGAAATAEATRVLEEARAQAEQIRSGAADELRSRTEEAETAAVRRIAEAEREAATIRVNARADADAVIEAARERGREMVGEAQAARERMLADLAKRKRAAQAHLEQMKVNRDRLLETLKVARRSIDDITMRFEVQEGSGPVASGAASAPITTTPGAVPAQARARPASPAGHGPVSEGREPEREQEPASASRPVRSRGLAIGEAPPASARPQISASQARESASAPGPQPTPAPPAPPADPAAPQQERERETRSEERRSSALRILRRHRQPERPAPEAPPRQVGRDSPAEGVRIIRGNTAPDKPEAQPAPEPAPTAPEPEPEPEPRAQREMQAQPAPAAPPQPEHRVPVEPEGEMEAEPEREAEPEVPDEVDTVVGLETAEAAELPAVTVELPAVTVAAVEVAPPTEELAAPVGEADSLAPLVRDEIRPRIEDLFARLRADREAAGATAASSPPADQRGTNGAEPPRVAAGGHSRAGSPVVTADRHEHLLQARDRVTEPLTGQLTRRLKRALQDEQNTTLDRLRTSRGHVELDTLLGPPSDQAEPYRRLAADFLAEAASAAAAASPFGTVPVLVEDLSAELGVELVGGLRARVRQVLSGVAGDDRDLSATSDRISSAYRECKTHKVERLAAHFLVAAHERGSFVAHPEGTPLQWIVDDEGPCPDCDDNALAGAVPRGQPFPTGQVHPPAHLGCRCLLSSSPT